MKIRADKYPVDSDFVELVGVMVKTAVVCKNVTENVVDAVT